MGEGGYKTRQTRGADPRHPRPIFPPQCHRVDMGALVPPPSGHPAYAEASLCAEVTSPSLPPHPSLGSSVAGWVTEALRIPPDGRRAAGCRQGSHGAGGAGTPVIAHTPHPGLWPGLRAPGAVSGCWATWEPPTPRLPFPACGWRSLLPSSTVALGCLAHPSPTPSMMPPTPNPSLQFCSVVNAASCPGDRRTMLVKSRRCPSDPWEFVAAETLVAHEPW